MVELGLEDMVRESVGIVRARVTHSGGQLVIEEGTADRHTITRLEIAEWLKGEGGAVIELREFGGVDSAGGQTVDGVPHYAVGEEVVVFLEPDRREPHRYYRTLGMVQGKLVVLRGVPGVPSVVLRDAEAVSFAKWTEGRMTLARGGQQVMAWETFVAAVEGVVALDALAPSSTRPKNGHASARSTP